MPRIGLTREEIIEKAAELANAHGLSFVTVTTLSDYLGIRKPSLYHHMQSIEDVTRELMLYGWKKASEQIRGIDSPDPGENLRTYSKRFYTFARANPGVFEAMLWYNKYESEAQMVCTEELCRFFFAQTERMQIGEEIANHLLRTYRSFLEGFLMLEIHHAFGNPISIENSFDISLNVLINGMLQYHKQT